VRVLEGSAGLASTGRAGSGDLTISGGGSVVVATDELRRQADDLGRLAGSLGEVHQLVGAIDNRSSGAWLATLDAPISAQTADRATTAALDLVRRSITEAERVSHLVRVAMYRYGVAEAVNTALLKSVEAKLGYTVGRLAPLLALMALPALTTVAATALLAGMAKGQSPAEVVRDLGTWARDHASVLTDPTTVALVRGAMSSSDDLLGGLLQVPENIVTMLGDDGVGLTGLDSTAMVVALLGQSAGLLLERPVTVTHTTTAATTPPQTLAGRAARIPEPSEDNGEQIRIDRYSSPGQPDRFEVYIAGTVESGIVSAEQPWDMTSNVNAIAGMSAASLSAVQDAMAQAGITSSSPVVLTGYSQGGLLASALAASAEYNVQAVVTFGAPSGLIEIPPDIPVLSVRHTDDIVTALGGHDVSSHALVAEREVYAGVPVPTELIFPAHQLYNYRDTARMIDDAQTPEVLAALAHLDDFAEGPGRTITTSESTTYLARRDAAG
jgi:pimeloyl-ACP methyl ester carboxylesterase